MAKLTWRCTRRTTMWPKWHASFSGRYHLHKTCPMLTLNSYLPLYHACRAQKIISLQWAENCPDNSRACSVRATIIITRLASWDRWGITPPTVAASQCTRSHLWCCRSELPTTTIRPWCFSQVLSFRSQPNFTMGKVLKFQLFHRPCWAAVIGRVFNTRPMIKK